jgi:mono/diheme cytochrome c family protein
MKFVNSLFFATCALMLLLAACGEKYSKKPGTAYMPDMAYSRAYEFYSDNPNFKNNMTAQAPVSGTIARGASLPDHIAEEDTNAAKAHRYDASLTMAQVTEGGRIYNIHCGVCHGTNLDGNGPLYNGGNGKYPAAPANFKDAKYLNMPVGTMYHAIIYGKNLMGSYASQLDPKQRWAVLAYIKSEQAKNGGGTLESYFTIAEEEVKATPAAMDANHKEEGHKETKAELKESKMNAASTTISDKKVETAKVETKTTEKAEEKKDGKTTTAATTTTNKSK